MAVRRPVPGRVEVGDPRQLRGVGCGSVFARVHQLDAGPALMENRRQRDEDERGALAAWRDGRYTEAWGSWSSRGRVVATEMPPEAASAMVGAWMARRAGAPDPYTELRGLVMVAATTEGVERLNVAAQAVRAATGELGPGRDYDLRGPSAGW
jgi:AAA domain